ncbi:unnamed protein product [Clonostachys byssicola]|uniref:Uncharacterized protein n=1 Tax=Clonostachys byssicola TaxID=160290 RepID=A0A9N9UCU6_9HYPO|nr:unnamed protein product [Clonostachys byssicola]
MANNIRGGGLFGHTPAPAALFGNPERLDREGEQSSEPPPPYRSRVSHSPDVFRGPTLFQGPSLFQKRRRLREEHDRERRRLREERKRELIKERGASYPADQFIDQKIEEMKRIEEASRNQADSVPIGRSFDHLAWENVKARWVEQGIWNEKWTDLYSMVRWKHEEPLELDSESEDDSAAEGEPRRLLREREREASRPFHQFVYQVSKERERIQDEMNSPTPRLIDLNRTCRSTADYYLHVWTPKRRPLGDQNDGRVTDESPHDINMAAYVRVKDTWTKRGIWNEKWDILPGMSWKHEQPVQEMLNEEVGFDFDAYWAPAPGCHRNEGEPPQSIFRADLPAERNDALVQANPPSDNRQRTEQAPPRPLFGTHRPAERNNTLFQANPPSDNRFDPTQQPPHRFLFGTHIPAGSNNQVSSIQNASQQAEPPTDTVPGVLESHGYGTGGAPSSPMPGPNHELCTATKEQTLAGGRTQWCLPIKAQVDQCWSKAFTSSKTSGSIRKTSKYS